MAYFVRTQCPVCGEPMMITRLLCRHCDTSIEGHFEMGRLYKLSPQQLAFVELFLRCEGKLNKVGEELGVSYPTVRARLGEIIRDLGYKIAEGPPLSKDDRRAILERLAAGEIDSAEAIKLLRSRTP